MMINMRSLPSSPLAAPGSTVSAYERTDLSFADHGMDSYAEREIPGTAHTAYFDTSHHGHGGYFGLPSPLAHASFKHIVHPGSARTSGDATRVGDCGSDSGSIIEMGLRKPLSP